MNEEVVNIIPEDQDMPEQEKTIFSLSNDAKVALIFVFGIVFLLGLIFYINSTKEAKEVALENSGNLPSLSLNGVLGSNTKQNKLTNPTQLNKQSQGPQKTLGTLPSSTRGTIELLNVNDGDQISTAESEYHVFGSLDTDGEVFNLTSYVNGSENVVYAVEGVSSGRGVVYDNATTYVTEEQAFDHDFKKFHLKLTGLNNGDNEIRLVLYGNKDKTKELSEFEFKINKQSSSSTTEVEFNDDAAEANKQDFFELLGIDLQKDSLWAHYPPIYEFYEKLKIRDFILEDKLTEYSIEELGKVEVDGDSNTVYKISYFVEDTHSFVLGYKKDGKFYYFPNATKMSHNVDGVMMHYFTASTYNVENVVSELTSISFDDSEDKMSSTDSPELCTNEDKELKTIFEYEEDYEVKENMKVVDKMGVCRQFKYEPKYLNIGGFSGIDDLDGEFNSYFGKVESDNSDVSGYYSPYSFSCENAFLRVLDDEYDEYLDEVTETDSGSTIYKFKDLPDSKVEDEWQDAYKSSEKYPYIIVEAGFGDYIMFLSEEYINVEEC